MSHIAGARMSVGLYDIRYAFIDNQKLNLQGITNTSNTLLWQKNCWHDSTRMAFNKTVTSLAESETPWGKRLMGLFIRACWVIQTPQCSTGGAMIQICCDISQHSEAPAPSACLPPVTGSLMDNFRSGAMSLWTNRVQLAMFPLLKCLVPSYWFRPYQYSAVS